jgi:hypothetical protein
MGVNYARKESGFSFFTEIKKNPDCMSNWLEEKYKLDIHSNVDSILLEYKLNTSVFEQGVEKSL